MNNQKFPRFLRLGDAALTIQFGSEISTELNQTVRNFVNSLEEEIRSGKLPQVIEYVPAVASTTIYFDPTINHVELITYLKQILEKSQKSRYICSHWELPICFDPSFTNDLDDIVNHLKISKDEILNKFCNATLQVFMIGFMPGFPFMGSIPNELSIPRKPSPRTQVPAQSVAIANKMCGIYPWESPGGWNLIGKMPIPLFDQNNTERPTLLRAGDYVSWRPITLDEFEFIVDNQKIKLDWDSCQAQMQ